MIIPIAEGWCRKQINGCKLPSECSVEDSSCSNARHRRREDASLKGNKTLGTVSKLNGAVQYGGCRENPCTVA